MGLSAPVARQSVTGSIVKRPKQRKSRLRPDQHVYDGRNLLGTVRETSDGFIAVAITGSAKRTVGLFSTLTAAVRALPPITITTPTKKRRPQPASTAAGGEELICASPKYAQRRRTTS